ncbi:MAG: hypothetical protein A2V70_13960 [Planctomycetes bacterium RBG_13_63_9]|nr:MAG: hypothetical protein A2V70_13960 [Planctomycetes bacterium RBG_13_63_9]
MFTEKAQAIIDLAKDLAFSAGSAQLNVSCLLAAVKQHPEARVLLAECLGLAPDALAAACPEMPAPVSCPGKLPLDGPVRSVLVCAKELASEVPDGAHPGLIGLRHLTCALAASRETCAALKVTPKARDTVAARLAAWYERDAQSPCLDELTAQLRTLRDDLLKRVFGQDHAVHAFVEGLFNAEVVAAADTERKAPRAVFVFAGPPGVGKTYLAELGASLLDRPFRRFDMSAFSGHEQNDALIGMAKMYRGAHPGALTEFVEKNPSALLLFDEIEKAHPNTIQLFLQVLDAGMLEDKYHERNVVFRDTIIIFTTNAGRKLYDRPNVSGIHAANAAFHRRTILDSLQTEADPRTGQPFFPAALCSRLATGYPVLFNHLRINELERVARAEVTRVANLLERQYYKQVSFDELVPMCLVLREGARADARTLRSQAEIFVKTELFKFCQLFETNRLEDVLEQMDRIHFALDAPPQQLDAEIGLLFESREQAQVLVIAGEEIARLLKERVPDVNWFAAGSADEALEVLAEHDIDLVLLDIWLGRPAQATSMTIQQFDHAPLAARGLDRGQELLRKIHERMPSATIYLLSLVEGSVNGPGGLVDEELFTACVRAGGARGVLTTSFVDDQTEVRQERRDHFAEQLHDTCRRLHREKMADRMAQQRTLLAFDTVPRVDRIGCEITVRLRNLRLARAVAAADASEVLEDVERPRTRFDDVIGADAAKEELRFFIDFLKNPRRFATLGLKPPKGVLLYGPPGTGKTMLARAMAGESDVAFISSSASSFVTIWQGSGPQNVRDLFARARRYAPAIVFIDEIDAIGRPRTGSPGGGQAMETTLNALLTEMDGFTSSSPERPVFVLAATNFNIENEDQTAPERSSRTLDPALVRRFSRTVLVDLPDRAARQKYLALRLVNRPGCVVSHETLRLIADRSTGLSIANLEAVVETAARNAAKSGSELTDKVLEEAFETVRFGEARPRGAEMVKRTACHEAGHTIPYWLSGWWPSYVTVIARGGHGGYMAPCAEEIERRINQTRNDLLASIRVSLGGRAAELIVFGPEEGLSTGASADLEHATNIARQMVCRYGMDAQFGVMAAPELLKYEGALSSPMYLKVGEAVANMLKTEMDRTMKLLEENRGQFDAVAEALVNRERLTAEDLQQILPPLLQNRLSSYLDASGELSQGQTAVTGDAENRSAES